MQTKLTKQEIGKLKQARNGIQTGVVWKNTDEGFGYWQEVINKLDDKIKHGTSDGKPWVEPEPPIPDGWRRAVDIVFLSLLDCSNPSLTRKDIRGNAVAIISKLHHAGIIDSDQGSPFDAANTRYIVPIDPPLTDQDACVWPRILVMVRDNEFQPWWGPCPYQGKNDAAEYPFVVNSGKDGDRVWKQARRATPAEIEAAK